MLLSFLISCKTTPVYIYPDIASPGITPGVPTHEEWESFAIDKDTVGFTVADSKIVMNYITDLKEYSAILRLYLNYYIKVTDYSKTQ